MGNQLVGIAPSQIFPVEHYFAGTFGTELIFDSNMGSTRFFKVAKAKSDEGLVVVKVFVKHDPTLPLEDHKERVEFIKKTLQNAVNCLPFQKVELTDKAAYIMREYVKHSLYDRVSTRPFLTVLEKKWITFQILCALNQCHKQKVCHGDIKLENILITSWNWILLSDFASFKPTYLPEDNPADYTYFFDTSRRRTCYIAPERFVRTLGSDEYLPDSPIAYESMIPSDSLVRLGSYYCGNSLLPSMDIFSAGCALLELWTEGSAPFEFSQLLAYRRGERDLVERHLKGIENENLRDLLSSMIDLNAINRKSAEDYLDQERGNLFPEYFYSFLQSYLQMFSSTPIMSPDDKILRLHSDIEHCITVLKNRPDNFDALKAEEEEEIEANINESYFCGPEHDGLILIITVVTSCIRGLQHCNTKICCLEILQKLSEYTTSETILDRILPYILHLAQDSSARVQVQAIETLSICLSLVKSIPRSDANVFPEYILPSIASLSTYPSTIVRVAFAKHIAQLAKTAVYFLEETQRNCPNDMSTRRYEAELNALHEILQQTVLSLLIDPQAVVKQTLIESGIHDLCAFFGKAKANDIILSHMITFLNDKEEKNLRGAFFDCIIGVVGYVGWQSSDILIPLLQQGLTDTEEFVIAKAFRATTALVDLGHMQKQTVTEFITESAPFLNHPNLWIRHEVCGLISITAKKLYPIDVQCKIMPAISSHLKCQLIQVEKPEILMDCLYPPIPRNIFDAVLRYSDIYKFIQALEDRMEVRLKIAEGYRTQTDEIGTSLKNLFRRLTTEGLNELIEKQLLSMKSFLIKLSKYKAIEPKTGISGKIILNPKDILYHKYPLVDKPLKTEGTTRKTRRSETDANSNLEWQHIFSGSEVHSPSISSPTLDSGKQTITGTSPTDQSNAPTTSSSLIEYSLPKRISWQERTSECRKDLEKLRTKIKTRYSVLAYNQNYNYEKYNSAYPPGWRMNGTLVAHLHEHSASVIKMTPLKPHGSLFVSGSIDGTVRLWDCNKLNGNQGINKSRQVYLANTPIYSVAACDGGQSLAVGGKDGSLLIMRIDRNSSKMTLQQAIHLVEKERDDGPVVDMQPFDQSSQSVIIYAKLYGAIVAWDTRMQTNAWRLQNELRHGVITAICADPTGSWLATGTSGGKHICWDLRFRLPIAEIKHPSDSWIRKVACHPTEPSCLISSSQSNNEVSVWNIETGHRQTVLWASQSPVLCNSNVQNVSSSTSCGILTGIVDNSPFVLTGSSDHRIRYWDLATPKNSSLIVPSAKDNLSDVSFSYDSRLIDGSRVIAENIISLNSSDNLANMRSSSDENPRSGPDMPSASHHDAITDLLMCKTDKQQTYIVSSARDGVIKIWK